MGRKADKRAARLASALEREWWASAAQCWVYIGDAIRWQTDPVYRAEVRAERAQRTMRTIMSLILATTMGCATVGGGWDTGKMKLGTDCKPHPISNAIPGLPKGATMPSPSTVIMDPKDKPKDGLVVIPADGCGGGAVRVIRLVEDGDRVKDPAGNLGLQKYRADDVPAGDWNK